MKNKIIAFRTSEELFNQYSALDIKSRKKFVNKCNELLTKFLLINVNNSNVNNLNVNNLNVNNLNVNNDPLKDKITKLKHVPDEQEINDFVNSVNWEEI